MKHYRVREILNSKGEHLYYEINYRGWSTLWKWKWKSCSYSSIYLERKMKRKPYIFEVWRMENGKLVKK